MANTGNTIEAVLKTTYKGDARDPALQDMQLLQQAMGAMQAAMSRLAGVGDILSAQLQKHAVDVLKAWTLAATGPEKFLAALAGISIASGIIAGLAVAAVSKLFSDFARNASELTELKLALESLAATVGESAEAILGRLKRATDGLISSTVLVRNANRILSADLPITIDQYEKLTANVFKLAKVAGVDGAQAINTLTDALIRGNARGLHAMGIHLGNVKDAISALAEAQGQQISKVEQDAKLRIFFNELIAKTTDAVARNTSDFISYKDVLDRTTAAWKGLKEQIGEGINRSEVFQRVLKDVHQALFNIKLTGQEVNGIALATNSILIQLIRTAAWLIEVLGKAIDTLKAPGEWLIQFFVNQTKGALVALAGLAEVMQRIFEALGRVHPSLGSASRESAVANARLAGELNSIAEQIEAIKDVMGRGSVRKETDVVASALRMYASYLEVAHNGVVRATAGQEKLRYEWQGASDDLKKLNEQTKILDDLVMHLWAEGATTAERSVQSWAANLKKIDELTLLSEEKRNQARSLAFRRFLHEMVKAEYEAEAKRDRIAELAMQKAELDLAIQQIGSAIAGSKNPFEVAPPPPNLGDDAGYRALRDAELARRKQWEEVKAAARQSREQSMGGNDAWLEPLLQAHEQLQKLNQTNMGPFQQTMAAMKASVLDFSGQAAQAWASFWADLVSGQEGAGKKLLAAFIGMIGQMLVKVGAMLVQYGIAEVVLAHTWIGKMMGASAAAGYKAIAIGAAIAAAGGIMMGAASSLAQTNIAGQAGSSFQQDLPRPLSSQQVQVIQVGAARGAQSPGQVAAAQQVSGTIRLEIEPSEKFVVKAVKNNVRSNGELRVLLASA